MICCYIALILLATYIIWMCIKNKKIEKSVSETFYKGGGWWFTIVLFISSFLITIGLLDLTEGKLYQFISFLTGAGMAFVGAAPKFHENLEGKVHCIGAGFLLVGSLIWLMLSGLWWALLAWASLPLWIKTKLKTFWCEITCFISILIGLLLN